MSVRKEQLADGVCLYLGRCEEVLPTLPRVDAICTDPPYGISDAPIKGQGRTGKRTGSVNVWHGASDWDAAIDPAWPAACCEAADVVSWFGHWRKREEVERAMAHPLRAEIIWAKDCHVGPPCPVAMRDERIWLFSASGLKGATFETSVWDCPIIPTWSHKHHKNEKPVILMERLIRWLGASTVCDPFCGSGTTGVAAVRLGVGFTGIEQDAGHFDTACRRITDELSRPRLFAEPIAKPVQEALFG